MLARLLLCLTLLAPLSGCFATEDMDDGCADEQDGDGDGLVDCEDVDCAEDPACGDDDDSAAAR